MNVFRSRSTCAPLILGVATLLSGVSLLQADAPSARRLVNSWEVHDEIHVNPGTEAAVKNFFPTFLEYQDLVMFHPKFGYYASGRVNFVSDYQTYPIVLNPFFGQMIAEQIFRMWQGMRRAGTLSAADTFTIAEFGAGNGLMAEAIMDYIERKGSEQASGPWHDLSAQVRYICYDRSPALNETQRRRNARFGKKFEARGADATSLTDSIQPGSIKGIVLSNELPDTFSVHKVILSADGKAEVAYVAATLPHARWESLRRDVPAKVAALVTNGDRAIREKFLPGSANNIYLTRDAFVALLEAMAPSKDYATIAESLHFHEIYVPVSQIPGLARHVARYARLYAVELARSEQGVVTYINLGVESFVQGAARVLKAGYVFTLDYGTNWEGMMAQDAHPHLRTYGPAHTAAQQSTEPDDDGQRPGETDTSDPYRGPTLNDMTTDVNFTLMQAVGDLNGLTVAYYGAQAALRSGTPILLDTIPAPREDNGALADEFMNWAASFETDGNYKLMVQQKEGTDPAYVYPHEHSERLASDEKSLSDAQRDRLAQIEKQLKAAA